MENQDAIVYLEGQWDCMCSEDCQIYTGHKDCPQGFICNDGQALQMAISALEEQDVSDTNVGDIALSKQAKSKFNKQTNKQSEFVKSAQQTYMDTIYRQAAINAVDAIRHIASITMSDGDKCIRKSAAKYVLSILPPAQPKRKPGKWNTYYHSDIEFSYSCNQCGYSAPYQMIGGEVFQKKWNFCPNCGSDNRGE